MILDKIHEGRIMNLKNFTFKDAKNVFSSLLIAPPPTATRVSRFLTKDKKHGFTLAETLITLTIIGIIAAMTVPNLMQNWQKQARLTQLKIAKTMLAQAVELATIEHGDPRTWDFSDTATFAHTYIFPYLKTTRVLNTIQAAPELLSQFGRITCPFLLNDLGNCLSLSGDNVSNNLAVLANGTTMGILVENTREGIEEGIDNVGARIYVDVNGRSGGPTMLGNDVFVFIIRRNSGKLMSDTGNISEEPGVNYTELNNKILTKSHNGGCNIASGGVANKGQSCARVIELSNWQFPDDYPIKRF